MDFINKICENTKDKRLLTELFSVDENRLEINTTESPDGDDYVLGVTHGEGAWITDPDNKIIYKRLMPVYFKFLKGWFHL